MFMFNYKYPTYSKKQHKRRKRSPQLKLNHLKTKVGLTPINSFKIYFKNNTVLPKNYIVYIRRKNKNFFKKKKIKVFFKLNVNYIISSKNKNSRMGKGVGTLNRFAFLKKSNNVFLEFNNINYRRLDLIMADLRKRGNTDYLILSNKGVSS